MLQIGQNIRQARDIAGLSQREVADMLKIKRTTYANYEGTIEPSLTIIMELAKLFNRHYIELIEGIGSLPAATTSANLDRLVPGPEASLEQLMIAQRGLRAAVQELDGRIDGLLSIKMGNFDGDKQGNPVDKDNVTKKDRSGKQK